MKDKRCLLLFYSLTGQAEATVSRATDAARAAGWDPVVCRIVMSAPEDTLARPLRIADSKKWTQGAQKAVTVPIAYDPPFAIADRYDAVLLFTNTWGDNPSVPIRSFLQSPEAPAVLAGIPFGVYVICRRLWEKNLSIVRRLGEAVGGRFIGGEAFTFPGGQIGSLIQTISYLHRSDAGLRHVLGVPLPAYGLSPDALSRIEPYTQRLLDQASATVSA